MNIELSVPSKTFLLGEYLALWGGPSLVITTAPRFQLKVQTEGRGLCQGIPPSSPAGHFVRQNNTAFQMVDAQFVDPYEGRGGLGASSAQFVLAYAWAQMSGLTLGQKTPNVDAEEMYKAYRQVTWTDQGLPPSGADVVAQLTGGICQFAPSPFQNESLLWPFKEYDFLLFRTGKKLATHEHLSELKRGGTDGLQEIVLKAVQSLRESQWSSLCDSVNEYGTLLGRQGWVSLNTQEIVSGLVRDSRVHAVKGCGAMGADVILILTEKSHVEALTGDMLGQGLEPVANSADLTTGLGVQMNFQPDLHPAEV